MTKIEELTELLVNEINDFNKGVTKLEAINDKISTTKISMDVTEYKSIVEKHQQKMDEQLSTQNLFENKFENLLKQAKVYPNWAVIVFILSLLFGIVSFVYSYNVKQNVNLLEKEAYQKGVVDSNIKIQLFFESHPKSKQAFEKWEEMSHKEN